MELTKSEQLILQYLALHCDGTFYESEISKATGTSTGAAHQSLKLLHTKDMVNLSKKGKMNFYRVNLENPLVKQFKITQTISELNGIVGLLRLLASRVILFGSCAEGLDTQDSDIDLAIITQSPQEVRNIIRKMKMKRVVQPLIVSASDFMTLGVKDKPLYERINRGIDLWRKA